MVYNITRFNNINKGLMKRFSVAQTLKKFGVNTKNGGWEKSSREKDYYQNYQIYLRLAVILVLVFILALFSPTVAYAQEETPEEPLAVEEPATEEPVAEESIIGNPATEETVTEETASEEPVAEELEVGVLIAEDEVATEELAGECAEPEVCEEKVELEEGQEGGVEPEATALDNQELIEMAAEETEEPEGQLIEGEAPIDEAVVEQETLVIDIEAANLTESEIGIEVNDDTFAAEASDSEGDGGSKIVGVPPDPYFSDSTGQHAFTSDDCDPYTDGDQPCSTPIQAAIDAAWDKAIDFNTIYIEGGTYSDALNINSFTYDLVLEGGVNLVETILSGSAIVNNPGSSITFKKVTFSGSPFVITLDGDLVLEDVKGTVTVTGGSGNDSVSVVLDGNSGTTITVNGGGGIDTLSVRGDENIALIETHD